MEHFVSNISVGTSEFLMSAVAVEISEGPIEMVSTALVATRVVLVAAPSLVLFASNSFS